MVQNQHHPASRTWSQWTDIRLSTGILTRPNSAYVSLPSSTSSPPPKPSNHGTWILSFIPFHSNCFVFSSDTSPHPLSRLYLHLSPLTPFNLIWPRGTWSRSWLNPHDPLVFRTTTLPITRKSTHKCATPSIETLSNYENTNLCLKTT